MKIRCRVIAALIAVAASGSGIAWAQDPLANARVLYDEAAYEEALTLLDKVVGTNATAEVHQYRALCLIALGRDDAAERVIAVVLAADPFFTPDSKEVAPRVVLMFAETRRKLLPQMVKRAFAEARTLFRDGERERANKRFDDVHRMLDDATLTEDPDLADLKLVAGGFLDLVHAQPTPSLPPNATASPEKGAASPEKTAAIEPAPAGVITPPVAITQTLPQWRPPPERRAFSGAVRVSIDAEGRVTNAVMERTVYPPYDQAVLEAARKWIYKPAMRDGQPIGSEYRVEIRLEPRPTN